MQQGSVSTAVMALPDIRKLMIPIKDKDGKTIAEPLPQDTLRKTVDMYVPMTVAEAARDYDFDFLCDYTTIPSVIGDATYVLQGRKTDCAYVTSIKYADQLLEQYNDTDLDAMELTSGVWAWYVSRMVNNFPEITLVNPPASVETISYRYIKKGISEIEWPEDFGKVLIYGVAAMIDKSYFPLYERGLEKMAQFYGKQKNRAYPPLLSKEMTNRNIERADMMGYRGRAY